MHPAAPDHAAGPLPGAPDNGPAPGAPADPQRARRVEQVLRRLSALPTLPAVATRLLGLSADEATDTAEVVQLIESDPAMSVAILRLLVRLDRTTASKPTSIERAVLSLGFRQVRDAALAVGVLGALPLPAGRDAAGLDLIGFWTHGVATGAAAERLAAACPDAGVAPSDAFLPGMLHDLGKLALQAALPGAYVQVVQAARRHGLPVAEAELRVLGVDHQTVGRRLARRWELPAALTECVWLHGSSPLALPEGPHRPLVLLVTAADALARVRHLGDSGSHDVPVTPEATLDALGLAPGAVAGALAGLEAEVAGRLEALGLAGAGAAAGDPLELYARAVGAAHADLVASRRRLDHAVDRGRRQRETLGSLEAFFRAAADARRGGLEAACEAVAGSARDALQAGRCLVVARGEAAGAAPDAQPEGAWLVADAAGGGARHFEAVESPWPPTPAGVARLLGDPSVAHLRPLAVPAGGGDGEEAVALLLSGAAEPGGADAGEASSALVSAWGSALSAAAERDRSERVGERLAAANRRLEASQRALVGREADARLREVAAGAAHEMNNPLAVILGRTEQLTLRLDGEALPMARAAHAAAGRLGELVAALGIFARPPVARRRPTAAAELAGEAVEAVRASRPLRREQMEPLELSLQPGAGLDAVEVDPELFRRVLDELVTNALQAHPETFVAVRLWVEDPGEGERHASLVLEVRDDGTGMDERTLQHAADPFFSRHAAGRRAGLGLARVTLWAQAHGGGLTLRSSGPGGTTARVRFGLP